MLARSKGHTHVSGVHPKGTPVTLGFLSPPLRPSGSNRSKVTRTLGLTSPLGRVPAGRQPTANPPCNPNSAALTSVTPKPAADGVPAPQQALPEPTVQPTVNIQQECVQPNCQKTVQSTGLHAARAPSSAPAQLPSFASFGDLFSPPARPSTWFPGPRQGIPLQPSGHTIPTQPSGLHGLPTQLPHPVQPYVQTSIPFSYATGYMGVPPAAFAASHPVAAVDMSPFIAESWHPSTGHTGMMTQLSKASTFDMLMGTDKIHSTGKTALGLPAGAVQIPSHCAAFQTASPSFFDSVAAFADGFALPSVTKQPLAWGMGACHDLHDAAAVASTCAMDSIEFGESDAAAVKLHELSEDGTLSWFDSEQMWKTSDMVCDTLVDAAE